MTRQPSRREALHAIASCPPQWRPSHWATIILGITPALWADIHADLEAEQLVVTRRDQYGMAARVTLTAKGRDTLAGITNDRIIAEAIAAEWRPVTNDLVLELIATRPAGVPVNTWRRKHHITKKQWSYRVERLHGDGLTARGRRASVLTEAGRARLAMIKENQ